jgi:hypothetical protein
LDELFVMVTVLGALEVWRGWVPLKVREPGEIPIPPSW